MDSEWVTLHPKAGLVVKSTAISSGFYYHNPYEFVDSTPGSSATNTAASYARIQVPSNRKVFINIAYASEIPPPLTDDEAIVQRALLGQVQEESDYFIPLIVGFGREDKDKAGNPSTVFDAFFNPAIKKRLTEDINYRNYVLEIVLSTLESPPLSPFTATSVIEPCRSLSLSRTLATPNVRFKGHLFPRKVQKAELRMLSGPGGNMSALNLNSRPNAELNSTPQGSEPQRALIEELNLPSTPSAKQPLKSILNRVTLPDIAQANTDSATDPHTKRPSDAELITPIWRWSIEKSDADMIVKMRIDVPDMTRSMHFQSKISLSTDIITLRTPKHFLQLLLNNPSHGVKMPLNRVVDIDKARAEWRIDENILVIYLTCILMQ